MYDLGPKPKGMRPLLICKEHYPQLLLESLFELYSKPYYVVTITDGSDGSVLLRRESPNNFNKLQTKKYDELPWGFEK